MSPIETVNEFLKSLKSFTDSTSNQVTRLLPEGVGTVQLIDLINGYTFSGVQLESVEVNQSVSSTRKGYLWTANFIAYSYEPITEKSVWAGILDFITGGIDKISVFAAVLNGYVQGTISYAISPIKNALVAVRRAIDNFDNLVNNTVYGVRDALESLRSAVADVALSTLSVVDTIRTAWEAKGDLYGYQSLKDMWTEWNDLKELEPPSDLSARYNEDGTDKEHYPSVTEVTNTLEDLSKEMEILAGYLGYHSDQRANNPVAVGGSFLDKQNAHALMAQASGAASTATLNDRLEGNYASVRLRAGETLVETAQRHLGDANEWSTLAEINGWLDAHTDGEGNPARAGMSVLIPEALGQPIQFNNNLHDLSGLLLSDIGLTADGDLDLERDNNDVGLVHGEDNLVQAIINRLRTSLGELPYQPEYGLGSPIGQPVSDKMRDYVTLTIIEQLSQDERIARVKDVVIQAEGDTFFVELSVVPIIGESVNITLPL
jgi:phage baseplate assembly protein W